MTELLTSVQNLIAENNELIEALRILGIERDSVGTWWVNDMQYSTVTQAADEENDNRLEVLRSVRELKAELNKSCCRTRFDILNQALDLAEEKIFNLQEQLDALRDNDSVKKYSLVKRVQDLEQAAVYAGWCDQGWINHWIKLNPKPEEENNDSRTEAAD